MDRLPYPYKPLTGPDSIRLLVIEPATDPATPLCCRLVHATLSSRPSFEALSYTWGVASNLGELTIDGEQVHIRRNLCEALYQLREPWSERALWADALCIDQSNLLERNHQVAQMRSIYSHAASVIVWLGRSSASSDLAMAWLEDMALPRRSDLGIPGRLTSHCPADIVAGQAARWRALAMLCSREYWRRLWIVQEVVLAERVVLRCGEAEAPWEGLANILEHWRGIFTPKLSSKPAKYVRRCSASRIQNLRKMHKTRGCTLAALMEATRSSVCSDPRDRVYALLGLSEDCQRGNIVVDYSLGLKEIQYGLWKFFIEDRSPASVVHGSQQLLQALSPGLWNDRSLDTFNPPSRADIKVKGQRKGNLIYAGQPWKSASQFAEYDGALWRLSEGGFPIGSQYELFCAMLFDVNAKDIHKVGAYVSLPCEDSTRHQAQEDSQRASVASLTPRKQDLVASTAIANEDSPTPYDALSSGAQWSEHAFWNRLDYHQRSWVYEDKCVMILSNGQMGLGPLGARAGDEISRFERSDVAAIIRRSPRSSSAGLGNDHIFGKALMAEMLAYSSSELQDPTTSTSRSESSPSGLQDRSLNFQISWDMLKWLTRPPREGGGCH